jgi:hypothetical protein
MDVLFVPFADVISRFSDIAQHCTMLHTLAKQAFRKSMCIYVQRYTTSYRMDFGMESRNA